MRRHNYLLILLGTHTYVILQKTGQARVGLAHREFRTKIGGLELFSEIQA